jgi:hypothetical protein
VGDQVSHPYSTTSNYSRYSAGLRVGRSGF